MNAATLAQAPAAAGFAPAPSAPDPEFERLMRQTFSPREILEVDNFDKMYRIAEQMANSRLTVPKHLQGNIADCLAIVTQAMLWNMNPFAVAQKTHLVNGTLGYEAQLVNAVLQNSGAVRGIPRYEYRGEGPALECRVGFIPRGETEVVWNEWLRSSDVTTKNSPLWKTNPKQQLGYLQIKNWARAFAPGAILGVYTVDELEDSPINRAESPAAAAEPAAAPKPELAAYAQADFVKNLPSWRKVVESGKKTAADLLAMLSTKATFSAQQQKQILALQPAQVHEPELEPELPTEGVDDFISDMDTAEEAQS